MQNLLYLISNWIPFGFLSGSYPKLSIRSANFLSYWMAGYRFCIRKHLYCTVAQRLAVHSYYCRIPSEQNNENPERNHRQNRLFFFFHVWENLLLSLLSYQNNHSLLLFSFIVIRCVDPLFSLRLNSTTSYSPFRYEVRNRNITYYLKWNENVVSFLKTRKTATFLNS